MKQLNVSITPHFAKFIHGKVKSGRYSNASEVVREALRRFEQDEEIRMQDAVTDPPGAEAAISAALNSVAKGDYTDVDGDGRLRAFFADIAARGNKRFTAAEKASKD